MLRVAAFTALLLAPLAAAAQTCLATPEATQRLAGILGTLAPVFDTLPALAPANLAPPPQLCLIDGASDAEGAFVPETNSITLKSRHSDAFLAAILLHELRHAEQFQRGSCATDEMSMQANAEAVAAMEADASAVSLLGAWLLKEHGDTGPWDALAAWPQQADIAARFADVMPGPGTTAALSAAFAQWFASETRVRSYYVASCSDYLDRLDRTHRLPSYQPLPPDFYIELCVLSGLGSYPCSPDAARTD